MMQSHLVAFVCCSALTTAFAQPPSDGDRAVAEILKVGGSVKRDDKRSGKPVVGVELTACSISEDGLKLLRFLTDLETLDL